MEDMYELMLPIADFSSTSINTTRKSRLETIIPPEIRNKIWRILLTTRVAFREPRSEGDGEAHYEIQPAILRVNRQIHEETRNILKEENMWIFLSIAMPKQLVCYIDETARLPVVSRSILSKPKKISKCYLGMNTHALNISLSPRRILRDRDYDCHIMLMGLESLPYLMQLLFPMLYHHRAILTPSRTWVELHVGCPGYFTRSRLQRELLEPFSAARGFSNVHLKGNLDETFSTSLFVKMRSSWQSDTELLEQSEVYLKKGDAAAAAGLTKVASFYYEQGSNFTFFAGQTYLDNYHRQIEHVYLHPPIASMLNAIDIR